MSLASIDNDCVTMDIVGIGSKERVNAIRYFRGAVSFKEELRGEASAVARVAKGFCDDNGMLYCSGVFCDAKLGECKVENILDYVLSYEKAILISIACFGLGFSIHVGVRPYEEDICRLFAISVFGYNGWKV